MPLRNPFDNFSFGSRFAGSPPKPFSSPNHGQVTKPYQSLFNDYSSPLPSNAPPEERKPDNDWTSYLTDMEDLYTKQGPAAGAYAEHMQNIPEYTKPSKMQRIGAALVGGMEGMRSGAGGDGQRVNQPRKLHIVETSNSGV